MQEKEKEKKKEMTGFNTKEEYQRLYSTFLSDGRLEQARLALDKLFEIEQIEKGERDAVSELQGEQKQSG